MDPIKISAIFQILVSGGLTIFVSYLAWKQYQLSKIEIKSQNKRMIELLEELVKK